MLKVIKVDKPAETSMGQDVLLVTVQGNSVEEVVGPDAKQLAFDECKKQGLSDNIGVGPTSGPLAIDARTGKPPEGERIKTIGNKENRADLVYHNTFRLTKMI